MKTYRQHILALLLVLTAAVTVSAQQRRPIDNQHPLWMIHIDVWNSADPQKIIDLIPDDIKPYVCMNLSLSCQFDAWEDDEKKDKPGTQMYRMPRNAVRTYKSWASVCQHNNMWFTCQPASGGHTHIQDNDLETFEYFFKTYPNFLGWNYAEQFWGFNETGDKSSMTTASRWALFANLVNMSHQYGGFLTVSWCGGIYHFDTDPIAELKLNADFLEACKNYPEAILFLYKYTHCSSFYNNESVCFGPFVSGLTKNYGVRYDNCGYKDLLTKMLGKNHGKKYPGAAGIGTVMEQTCVNGGAVWDGPELIWDLECFQNQSNSTVDGYTRRNWTTFGNFRGIWLDMWRKVIDGTMYIPTREEVVAKTKAVILHDATNDFKVPDALYDGLYKVSDPANRGNGYFEDNLWYLKSTGRYGAIPMVTGFYDEAAKNIPVRVNKSNYNSRWGTQSKKVSEFNSLYPEVSKGDLYVNRYHNQLITYTPYTYLNKTKTATGELPLLYNSCDSLKLTWNKLTGAVVREYADSITFYINNYRNDTTTNMLEKIIVTGCKAEPTYKLTKRTAETTTRRVTPKYDAETKAYTLTVEHMGPIDLTLYCSGEATDRLTDLLPDASLGTPKQPEAFKGTVVIEAENMDYKSVGSVALTSSGWWASNMKDFAGIGYIQMGTNKAGSLRHQLTMAEGGDYDVYVRYFNTGKAGTLSAKLNSATVIPLQCETTAWSDWHKVKFSATLKAGKNTFILNNAEGLDLYIDQIMYVPKDSPAEKYYVKVRESAYGKVIADVDSATEGQTVHLTVIPDADCALKELRVVNSVYFTEGKTIPINGDSEVTFVMNDDNITLQPVFYDKTMTYELDFTNVANGTMPEGWRATDGNDVHSYPNSYGSGPRTFTGFTGFQGSALYWRNTSAEYGSMSAYPLKLDAGDYKLLFTMAAWKGTPSYNVTIVNASTKAVVATSPTYSAAPNANGVNVANLSAATQRQMDFTISQAGNYIVRYNDKTSGSGMHEFLLLESRVKSMASTGIAAPMVNQERPFTIYDLSGRQQQSLGRGINIIRNSDGSIRKVIRNRR